MDGLADKTLVAQACSGSRQAYAELIRRHYKAVFLACLGRVGRTCDAEDTAQETFLKGFTEIRRLRDGPNSAPGYTGSPRTTPSTSFGRDNAWTGQWTS